MGVDGINLRGANAREDQIFQETHSASVEFTHKVGHSLGEVAERQQIDVKLPTNQIAFPDEVTQIRSQIRQLLVERQNTSDRTTLVAGGRSTTGRIIVLQKEG
jgi:hypothetical protein